MKGHQKFQPESYYHLVNHAVGSENLFRTADNYHYFLKRYAHYMPSLCDTLAYCLMPNHIHFLIKVRPEEDLITHPKYKGDFHKLVMQGISNLLNSYAKSYNKKYERKGALWLDFTKRFEITSDNYLTSVINYIHQNPVKHKFVNDIENWYYSSYHSLLSTKSTLLSRSEVIKWFGSNAEFESFHQINKVVLLDEFEL